MSALLPRPVIPQCPACGAENVETLGSGKHGRVCCRCLAPVGSRRRRGTGLNNRDRRRRFQIVAERDDWTCWICESPVDPLAGGDEAPTLDHVIPVARGGGNGVENLRLAHYVCNQWRGCPDG